MRAELFFLITVLQCVLSLFIKSGLDFNENNGRTHDLSFRNLGGQKNEGNLLKLEGKYNDRQLNKLNSQDASRFAESSGAKVSHLDQNKYQGDMYHQDAGVQAYEEKKNIGHRKGHKKSGFHKSYCKDESGNNSSYYDDEHDEGNQYIYDGRNKNYDGSSSYQQKNQNIGAGYYNKDQGLHKLFDNRNNLYNDRGDNAYYNRKYYDREADLYGKYKGKDFYGKDGYYAQNRYYNRPYYTDTYDNNYAYDHYPRYSVQRWRSDVPIEHYTDIYEDPHYLNDEYSRNSYTDEYGTHNLGPSYRYHNEYYSSGPDTWKDYYYY